MNIIHLQEPSTLGSTAVLTNSYPLVPGDFTSVTDADKIHNRAQAAFGTNTGFWPLDFPSDLTKSTRRAPNENWFVRQDVVTQYPTFVRVLTGFVPSRPVKNSLGATVLTCPMYWGMAFGWFPVAPTEADGSFFIQYSPQGTGRKTVFVFPDGSIDTEVLVEYSTMLNGFMIEPVASDDATMLGLISFVLNKKHQTIV